MTVHRSLVASLIVLFAVGVAAPQETTEQSAAPSGLKGEAAFPGRQQCVADDALRLCRPRPGFWVDLGAGKAEVAVALIQKGGNAVLAIDPNAEVLTKGLETARETGFADRLFAVTGRAEDLPLPDNSVDFLVSRGSIFFWDDAVKGLKDVNRVLRPGGKAYIGGGAGRDYPQDAVERLIRDRKERMLGEEAEKWNRFVELRRPEQMYKWAEAAELKDYRVLGQGAISAADADVGQGVWLVFEKK